MKPIEVMFDGIEWTETGLTESDDGIPVALRVGKLTIADLVLDCAVLSNGQRVFFGEGMADLVGALADLEKSDVYG